MHLLSYNAVTLLTMLMCCFFAASIHADNVELEEIIVIEKFQKALSDALAKKRLASEVMEALTAEDIGRLPNTSIAESLARLPGVTATREVAGAGALAIRGLGAVLSNGTFNGRDLASPSGDRSVSFRLFPAELIAGASVYKAPAASRIEGGVAGTVDLRTVRPLEYGERSVVLNVNGRYNDLGNSLPDSSDKGVRGSASYIDQFAQDTIGITLGYAGEYVPFASLQSAVYNYRGVDFANFITGLPDLREPDANPDGTINIPYGADQDTTAGDSTRHSWLGTLQYDISADFTINADVFYTIFEQENLNLGLTVEGLGSFGNDFADAQTDGLNLISATQTCDVAAVGSVNDCRNRGYGQSLSGSTASDSADSTLSSFGLGAEWNRGLLMLTADVSYSRARENLRFARVDYRPYGETAPGVFELVLPVSSYGQNDDSAAFLTTPLDFADAAGNRIDRIHIGVDDKLTDEIYTYKLDAVFDVERSFLSAIKTGVRYVDRKNVLDAKALGRTFLDIGDAAIPTETVAVTPFVEGVFNHAEADSRFAGNNLLVLDAETVINRVFADKRTAPDVLKSHVIDEEIISAYGQLDFKADSFLGVPMNGNAGVRVVDTTVRTSGVQGIEGVNAPIRTRDSYTKVLPSINLNFGLTDELIMRIGASRTMARPAFSFLSPGSETYGSETYGNAGGGGNPYLRPFVANQVDVSFEQYFSADTALAVALFYKDIDTFITQARTESQTRTESGTLQTDVSFLPANGQGGSIKGIEALYQQFFPDLLPAGGIGIYANYSYNDSNITLTETFDSGSYGLDGLSKHVGNVTLYYDYKKFGARVSYRYRSAFTRPQRPARAFITNKGEGELSFALSYAVTDNFDVYLDGWNLLNEPRDSYYGLDSLQGQYRVFGRSFALGAHYRF